MPGEGLGVEICTHYIGECFISNLSLCTDCVDWMFYDFCGGLICVELECIVFKRHAMHVIYRAVILAFRLRKTNIGDCDPSRAGYCIDCTDALKEGRGVHS